LYHPIPHFGGQLKNKSVPARIVFGRGPAEYMGMPVFIQHSITGEYVAPQGCWTGNVQKAKAFDQVLRAWEEIEERRLSGIQIIIRSRDGTDEQTIQVAIGANDSMNTTSRSLLREARLVDG
jgi:hypothetical protein